MPVSELSLNCFKAFLTVCTYLPEVFCPGPKRIKYCWFTFLFCQILHCVAHYSSCTTSHLAVGAVVALLGSLAQAIPEGSWGRRCWDAPWGLAQWSYLNYCRSNPTKMTSNREVLCFTSVGNASVDRSCRF